MNLYKIARRIELRRCAIHGEHPSASPKKDSIELQACCEVFSKNLQEEIKQELAKQAKAEISKALKF